MIKKIIMPKLGETMEEGEIIKWLKSEGDKVRKGEPLLEVATDKANMEVEATASGYVRKILAKGGEKVPVTKEIAYLADSMEEEIFSGEKIQTETIQEEKEEKIKKEEGPPAKQRRIKASPLAKRLAREKGIDLKKIEGTGPGGRIVKEDILKATEREAKPEPEEISAGEKEVSLSRVEKIMAERMRQSKKNIPHFYLSTEVDFSQAVKFRNDLVEEFEKERKVRISYTDLIIKACGRALLKFPRVNSHYKQGRLVSFSRINLGLAVAKEQGLVVPVIKNAGRKNLFEIAKERQNLVKKAAESKLPLEYMEGGTFTLSNLGMMQIKNFTAIINPPQIALLATGQIKEKVVVNEEGEISVAPIMEITLSCDHRAIDGYLGSKFLQEVKEGLEKPVLLIV